MRESQKQMIIDMINSHVEFAERLAVRGVEINCAIQNGFIDGMMLMLNTLTDEATFREIAEATGTLNDDDA